MLAIGAPNEVLFSISRTNALHAWRLLAFTHTPLQNGARDAVKVPLTWPAVLHVTPSDVVCRSHLYLIDTD
jgi:hypothetical protein